MNVVKWVSIILIATILLATIFIAFVMYKFGKIQIRQTKDYAVMYVDENDFLDSEAMISPPEKYSQLLQIDLSMRKRIAEYMENNNYKLKSGKQEFIRNNPSFEELIEDGFQFEDKGRQV